MVKDQTTPISPHLWWRVEQVFEEPNGHLLVLWSRPEPLRTH
jgi:hypothetical protein